MYTKIESNSRMAFQSDLRPIVKCLKEEMKELTWIISHHEFMYLNMEHYAEKLNPLEAIIRIHGKQLVEILEKSEIQFVWGVLSGRKEIKDLDNFDYDELNLKNYSDELFVLDKAELEIDCFDSSWTTIRTKNNEVLKKLNGFFNEK